MSTKSESSEFIGWYAGYHERDEEIEFLRGNTTMRGLEYIAAIEVMTALCCGEKCQVGPNTGLCHRLDFSNEADRVMVLIGRKMGEAVEKSAENLKETEQVQAP